jgi:hypothetical protein
MITDKTMFSLMFIFGPLFFGSIGIIFYRIKKKYPNLLKVKSKYFLGLILDQQNADMFWREIFRPTYKKDILYLLYINLFRLTVLSFFIVGIVWMIN